MKASLLIAHRGGVVDEHRSENSFAALEEAIRRRYTHVEIDARITADGGVVCFHNDGLAEEAGIPGRVSEMSLADVTQVTLTRSGEQIPTFDEYCARCAGRIGVMIDLKGCQDLYLDDYTNGIRSALDRHGLLDDALILINKTPKNNQDVIAQRFSGQCLVSWRRPADETERVAEQDPGFAKDHYVFNHGEDFSESDIERFHALGLTVIASINRQHYSDGDPIAPGQQHIRQLRDWVVDGFQIDSCYDVDLLGGPHT